MFCVIASTAACAVMHAAEEAKRIQTELDALPPAERKERLEFYARRAHERNMERIAQEQADALKKRDESTGFLPFIFGMVIGSSGK